jgi:prevent-host-death family protein
MFRGLIQWVEMTCSARLEAVVVKKVRVTETKAHLSALMARAGYAGERYPIERRGKPLAALVGVEDLQRLEAEGGPPIGGPRGRWWGVGRVRGG